jgi:hypothetical protein
MGDFLTKKIKEWVVLDNKIKEINNQVKQFRDQKNTVNTEVVRYVQDNNLNNAKIQISDGQLKFVNSKITHPLTFKFLEECLNDIINDKDKVNQIILYIKQQRDVKSVMDIKRYYN